jgi:acetylornithine/succinyldiaminopimelate/putrescine aminotransferase
LRAFQENGVLVLPATSTTFRLLPPLVWDESHVEEFIGAATTVL